MGFTYNSKEVLHVQYVLVQIIDNRQIIVPDFPKSKYRPCNYFYQLGVVVQTFNPSTEVRQVITKSPRSAWSA